MHESTNERLVKAEYYQPDGHNENFILELSGA